MILYLLAGAVGLLVGSRWPCGMWLMTAFPVAVISFLCSSSMAEGLFTLLAVIGIYNAGLVAGALLSQMGTADLKEKPRRTGEIGLARVLHQ